MKIFYNPSCSKCRTTLGLLHDREDGENEALEVVEYLKEVPSIADLKDLLLKLGMRARGIVRDKEPVFLENYAQLDLNDDEAVLKALVKHPILIERPIVVRGDRAVIGRPPENIEKLWE